MKVTSQHNPPIRNRPRCAVRTTTTTTRRGSPVVQQLDKDLFLAKSRHPERVGHVGQSEDAKGAFYTKFKANLPAGGFEPAREIRYHVKKG